jgi:hypothetical protein
MTRSSGRIRFLRSDSRNSATVFASTPALLAARPALREVVFAVLRAFCWRARAWPPFFAAALRFAALGPDELERLELDFVDFARLEVDRLDAERERLDALAPERDPPDDLRAPEPLPDDLLLEDLLLEGLLPELPEPPLAFLLPPRCCAMCVLSLLDLANRRAVDARPRTISR